MQTVFVESRSQWHQSEDGGGQTPVEMQEASRIELNGIFIVVANIVVDIA
ncbi:hypothetical protein NKH57_25530 [Mesorhizobium sp. M1050]